MSEEVLVQFLVLAKGAKGAACVALIQQVLSHKKIFVFGELLSMPNVQSVRRHDGVGLSTSTSPVSCVAVIATQCCVDSLYLSRIAPSPEKRMAMARILYTE